MSIYDVDSGSFLRVLEGLVLGLTGIYAINGLWHLHCWLVELHVTCPRDIGYAALSRLLTQLDSKRQKQIIQVQNLCV
jgi:hypothetical protein